MLLPDWFVAEAMIRCQALTKAAPYPVQWHQEKPPYRSDIVVRYAPGRERTFEVPAVECVRAGTWDGRAQEAALQRVVAFLEGLGAMLDVMQQRAMLDAEAAKAAQG